MSGLAGPDRAARAVTLLVPLAVFGIAFVLLRHWIVDDAGITFAYARTAAAGYGLASQPGQPPVEGYSNFLWLAVLLPFFRLGLFDATWTPKLLSLVLVAATFVVVGSLLVRRLRFSPVAAAVALTLVAANPAFAVWAVSGLENPLLAFLSAVEWSCLAAWTDNRGGSVRLALALGMTASAIALTRPDGALYCVAVPAILVAVGRGRGGAIRDAAVALATSTLVLAAFLAFRWTTFHELRAFAAPRKRRRSSTSARPSISRCCRQIGCPSIASPRRSCSSAFRGSCGVCAMPLPLSAHTVAAQHWPSRRR